MCSISGPVSRKRRMLRAAWRMRCSFSTKAMRTWPSPFSPKPAPGRHRDASLLDQQGRELNAAERLERFGNRRPGEHRGPRRRHPPAGAAERIHQRVAPAPVDRAHLVDAIVRTVERRGGGDLDRRKGAVVEIGFHPRQRRDDTLVADGKADAPARHRIGFRHRSKFDGNVHGAGNLQNRGRRIVIEIDLGIGEIRQHQEAVLLRKGDKLAIEVEVRQCKPSDSTDSR